MTAPEIVEVVAGVLKEHWTFSTHGDFDALVDRCDGCHADIYNHGTTSQTAAWAAHQARAVLAALEAVGTVEWGVERGGEVFSYYDEYHARESAAFSTSEGWAATAVSRRIFPWAEVEG